MVAVLQYIPEDDYCHVAPVRTPLRAVPEHVFPEAVPEFAIPEDAVPEVHRQPSPRVTRSKSAAVYWRRRLVAAALGLGVLLTAMHAGAALGGTTTTASERSPHVNVRDRPAGRHALVDRPPARAEGRHPRRWSTRWPPSAAAPTCTPGDSRQVAPVMAASNAPVMRGSLVGARARERTRDQLG